MKDDGLSDGEDDTSTDALVEEMLQQGDTAVIYPEAPEDEPQRLGTPDTSIHDENGMYNPNITFLASKVHTQDYNGTVLSTPITSQDSVQLNESTFYKRKVFAFGAGMAARSHKSF